MKWDKQEMGNQYAHSAIGRVVTVFLLGAAYLIVGNPTFQSRYIVISCIICSAVGAAAFLIELIQFIVFDNFDAKLPDRIRDWAFYVVESAFVLILFYYGMCACVSG